jgi:hypothetical protein
LSQQTVQKKRGDIELDHQEYRNQQVGECNPDWIDEMELYYVQHPKGFAGKIMLADWISLRMRKHMIEHVKMLFGGIRKGDKRTREVNFRQFVQDPNFVKGYSVKARYGKHKDGTVYKQDTKTGRFVSLSPSERKVVKSGKATK